MTAEIIYAYVTAKNRSALNWWTVHRSQRSYAKEKAPTFQSRLVFALPIFPGSRPPSIVGVHELNFCVRDGNRWTLMTINTNSYSVALNHLYIKSLATCDNEEIISSAIVFVNTLHDFYLVTHTGFEPMLTA